MEFIKTQCVKVNKNLDYKTKELKNMTEKYSSNVSKPNEMFCN